MLSFDERGRGPALLFIHAYPLDHSMWDAQMAFFSKRFRVVAPDIIGFGGSQPPRPWTIPDMVQALVSLLDHLKIEKCTPVGLSIGGYIGLPFALIHPDRVERLVLAHTRARADLESERAARNAMIEGLRKDGVSSLPEKMLPRLLGASASPEVRNQVRASIERASAEASIHAVTAMRERADQTGNLSRLRCPTLVIAGSGDAILKVEDCQSMAAAIPGAEFVVIPNTGHLSNLEDPPAFNEALDGFLRKYDSK
jgi:pimeloyl-ACP methyl ester carboxylesterase